MKFPQTPEEVENEILISSEKAKDSGDLRIRQFIKILLLIKDQEIIVEGIIRIFENADNFLAQEFAGKVLEEINPKTHKDLKEVLTRTVKKWNVSVEQLPVWLQINYGLPKLQEVLEEHDTLKLDPNKIRTIRYWLNLR
ncbi:hypothetical protein QNI19_25395 [Cytophagaceae bacterium DM2B3-1]|uniref:Uncharacterized protein n=1 Tax=Xanthocytophaga flava TaxID=3048013 RepID=A0ABT7CRE0_9BACT|nr:hypothetical protein [Xanthocytophaga flavus]MDJ1496298.1 hypothetical protein [Xanthocytophaga flavus]